MVARGHKKNQFNDQTQYTLQSTDLFHAAYKK